MYYDMLLEKWNLKLGYILNEDNYSCMEIKNENEFNKLIKEFPCQVHVSGSGRYFLIKTFFKLTY